MQHIIQARLFLGRLAVGHADELLIGLPELLEGGEGLVGRADRAGVQDDAAARELLTEEGRIVRAGIGLRRERAVSRDDAAHALDHVDLAAPVAAGVEDRAAEGRADPLVKRLEDLGIVVLRSVVVSN